MKVSKVMANRFKAQARFSDCFDVGNVKNMQDFADADEMASLFRTGNENHLNGIDQSMLDKTSKIIYDWNKKLMAGEI